MTSMICPGCACLCDDIDLVFANNALVNINNVCQWGSARFTEKKKFTEKDPRKRLAGCRITEETDKPDQVPFSRAVKEARQLINDANRIVVYGLCQMSQDAFDPLLTMLRNRNTVFIPSEGPLWSAYLRVLEKHSLPVTTLESIRNEADLVVFWGANPTHSCPRLVSRYALFARGRFTERGIEDRSAFTIDIRETEMARITQMATVDPADELRLLQSLKAASTHSGDIDQPSSFSKKNFHQLLEAFEKSHYRVIFCGRGPFYGSDGEQILEEMADWIQALNRSAPTFLLPMATDFNTVGFYRTFWQTEGRHDNGWKLLDDLHQWQPKKRDLLLAVSGDCLWFATESQKQDIIDKEIPIICLSAYETMTTAASRIAFGVAMLGVDGTGFATRMDGVVLPLRSFRDLQRPLDSTVLEQLSL